MKRLDLWGLCIGLLGLGIMIWYIVMLIPDHLNVHYGLSIEKSAMVGDFIGGVVATLFSIAAFLLLYETLNTQKKEIKDNQTLLQKQSFETNLFQMINMHNDIIKEFDIRECKVSKDEHHINESKIIAVGRDSFYFVYQNDLKDNIIKSKATNKDYVRDEVVRICFNKWKDDLNHYFKHACAIIQYIDRSSPSNEDKLIYLRLFSSGLSDSEKSLLFYHIIFDGDEDLKAIVKKYDFFYDLPQGDLIDNSHEKWLYD